jgi:predicted permease
MVAIGKAVAKVLNIKTPYFPLLFGGFEAGMMGYSIFISVYGANNVDKFAVTDLGQVIFVFFVLMALLMKMKDGVQSPRKIVKMFVTSPIIIAIFLGVVTSLLKMAFDFENNSFYLTLVNLLNMTGSLTVPLICIVIGYELKFNVNTIKLPLITILLRTVFLVIFALIINSLVFTRILNLDPIYRYALMTMFILPPPFVMPLFLKEDDHENRSYIVNTLSISTVFSLFVFILVTLFYK